MTSRRLLRARRWLLAGVAALPLFQFFTGCSPNIPGLPNLPGAILTEFQLSLGRVVVNAFSTILSNILNL